MSSQTHVGGGGGGGGVCKQSSSGSSSAVERMLSIKDFCVSVESQYKDDIDARLVAAAKKRKHSDEEQARKQRGSLGRQYTLPLPPVADDYQAELRRCDYPDNFLRPAYRQPSQPLDAVEFMITDMDTSNEITALWDVERKYKGRDEVREDHWSFYVRLFGVTEQGHSVSCYLAGWKPYLYVQIPERWNDVHVQNWIADLETKPKLASLSRSLVAYSFERRINIFGYTKGTTIPVLKMEFANGGAKYNVSKLLAAVKDEADGQIKHQYVWNRFPNHRFWLWDGAVDNLQQFINATGIAPSTWMRVEKRDYQFHQSASVLARERRTRCQIDINSTYGAVQVLRERDDIPPLLVESWDIEVMRGARDRKFPNAAVDGDEIFQIGTSVMRFGDQHDAIPYYSAVHCVRPTDNLRPDSMHVNEYKDEADMLRDYAIFTRDKVDADIRVDFNGKGFDRKYWEDRAARHFTNAHCDRSVAYKYSSYEKGKFEYGRVRGKLSECKEKYGGSRAHGSREENSMEMIGRAQLDLFQWSSEEWGMPRSLNDVAEHIYEEAKKGKVPLRQEDFVKLDLPFYVLHEKYVATSYDRGQVAEYCAVDTQVPLRILDVKKVLMGVIEISRLTGITINDVINKKQMARTFAKLSKYAHDRNYMLPEFPERFVQDPHLRDMMFGDGSYEGATVIEPQRGFHNTNVGTLDFAGLYPSIMRGYGLCYTTLILDKKWLEDAETEHVKITIRNQDPEKEPYELYWCTNWDPLLYGLLTEILDARAAAKALKKKHADDPFLSELYDARQLGLKLIANSTYGFCGAKVGKLPNLAIAAAVTHFGRELIETTARIVEEQEPACKVIYGDTDSVMIKFPSDWSDEECFAVSYRLADFITDAIGRKEVQLEFEKIYKGYLLIGKKNYAGLKITRLGEEPVYATKGIASVRGDKIGFVKRNTDNIVKCLLYDRSEQKAIQLLKDEMQKLVDGQIDPSELMQEKKLTKALHEYPPNVIHVRVAREMHRRDPGTAPKAGEMVGFVVVQGKDKVNPVDFKHFMANRDKYKLDIPYYIENLCADSLGKLLDFKEICDDPFRFFEPYLAKANADKMGVQQITSFLKVSEVDTSQFVKATGVKRGVTKRKKQHDQERAKKHLKEEAKRRGVTVASLQNKSAPSIMKFLK